MSATIYAGLTNPTRCAEVHQALKDGAKVKDLSERYGCAPSTIRNQAKRHEKAKLFSVSLERDGERTISVCHVITPGGAMAAAVAAFRHYSGTLKALELPGWRLRVSDEVFSLADVRKEAGPQKGREL